MIRFNKYLLIIILLVPGLFAYGQKTDSLLTLPQCLDIAIKNNLQVRQSERNAESTHIDLWQARENMLPNINAGASRSFYQGRGVSPVTNAYVNQSQTNDSYSVSGNMTLFNGFALLNAVKSASYAFQAGKMDFQSAKDVVTVNVITAYLAILDAQELLNANKSQLAAQQETVNRFTILEQQGANKAASDLTDQQGQLEGNKVAVVSGQNNLDAAKLALFQLMNIPYQPSTQFQSLNAEDLTGDYGTDPDKAYQVALQQFAAVKSAILKRESAQKNLSSLRGYYYPQIYLSGGLGSAYSNTAQQATQVDTTTVYQNIGYGQQLKNNYNSYVTIGLNIPIFNNGLKRNAVSKAKLNLLNAKDVEDNTKIQLKQSVEQAYYNMSAAYKRYQALEEQVKAYTESYRIYKIRFDAGVLTSVDLIIAKNNMDSATLNLISARYDYFIDSKILDYYQGKLSLQ
jgi:outer membrane protein